MDILTGVLLIAAGAIGGLGFALWWVSEELRELDKENQRLHDDCDTLEVMWRQPQSANKVWRGLENVEKD